MKYFFSSPMSKITQLQEAGVQNYLLSFAVDGKECKDLLKEFGTKEVIIDSGAFSVWNKGGTIDINAYVDFCLALPQTWTFVNLDVIPKTGSSKEDIEECCKQGYENYLFLKSKINNILPVYHYGDDIKWMHKYLEHTNYIGVSPANDIHEKEKRKWLKTTFKELDIKNTKIKTHGFGYSSFEGLTMFPFYSIDSISYKHIQMHIKGKKTQFWANSFMDFVFKKNVERYLNFERSVSKLWEERGLTFN